MNTVQKVSNSESEMVIQKDLEQQLTEVLPINFDSIKAEEREEKIIQPLSDVFKQIVFFQKEGLLTDSLIGPTLRNQISKIFYLYGRCVYGGDMNASKNMMQLSLLVRLIAIPAFETDELKNLSKNLNAEDLDRVEAGFGDLTQSAIVEMACSDGDSSAFEFASTLRWLGHSYQNLSVYQKVSEINRFQLVYGAARSILEKLDNDESRWEIGQLLYNTTRFIHNLQYPNDVKGATETLSQVLPYLENEKDLLKKNTLQAQIYNIQAVDLGKLKFDNEEDKLANFESQYNFASKAYDIAIETSNFNPFLQIMFANNKVAIAFKCFEMGKNVASTEELIALKDFVKQGMENTDYNHYYHAYFCLSLAKFEAHYCKNTLEASKLIQMSREVATKFPDSTKDLLKQLEDFSSQLELL